ncbi:MAG: hypothetical protein RL274_2115 [Pseudomonadota bacterium]|jgi:hypothetical protein
MSLRKILLASVLMTATVTSAMAEEYGTWNDNSAIGSLVVNDQVNLQTNWSNLSGVVDTVGGDVVAQGAAAGNIMDVITMDNTRVFNNQIVSSQATIGSNVSLDANNVWGSVGVNNTSLCNGASVSTDPVLTSVNSYQECGAKDPYTGTSAFVTNIAGNAVFQNSAISNSFEADSNAPNFPVFNKQINNSSAISNMAVNAFNVGGTVGLSSSAIGNTSRVIHYNTGGR